MSLETEIREAFERHADDATPSGGTWPTIERRIRRSHSRRVFLVGAGAALAIAAVAVAAPRIGDRSTEPVVPGPVKTEGWQVYQNDDGHYRMLYPPAWSWLLTGGGADVDVVSFTPDDPAAIIDGKNAFEVAVRVEDGRGYDDLPAPRPEITRTRGRLGSREYVRDERTVDQSHTVTYMLDRSGPTPSCPAGAPCPAARRWLSFTIFGATDVLWSRYSPIADRMFRTVGPPTIEPSNQPSVAAKIAVPAAALAAGPDAVWALQRSEVASDPGRLVRIDPRTNRPGASIEVGVGPTAVAADADAVWVVNGPVDGLAVPYPMMNSVMRIDPRTNQVVATIRVADPQDVAIGFGSTWVTALDVVESTHSLIRIDPVTNTITQRIELGSSSGAFAHLAVGDRHVWVTIHPEGSGDTATSLVRVDPETNQPIPPVIALPALDSGTAPLAYGEGAVWVSRPGSPTPSALSRIDPATGEVRATITVPDPSSIGLDVVATGGGYVWAAGGQGLLWQIDPRVNAPVANPLSIGDTPAGAAADVLYAHGSLWAASGDGHIWRLTV